MQHFQLHFCAFLIQSLIITCTDAADSVCKDKPNLAGACTNSISDAECDGLFNDPDIEDLTVDEKCLNASTIALNMCPLKCLACCKTPAYDCSDSPSGLPITCEEALDSHLCNDADIFDELKKHCPQTCGLCDSTCIDSSPELCKSKANDCEKNKEFMLKICPKTCGKCDKLCTDANPKCEAWVKNGFCTNDFYPVEVRRKECAKSCNLCS